MIHSLKHCRKLKEDKKRWTYNIFCHPRYVIDLYQGFLRTANGPKPRLELFKGAFVFEVGLELKTTSHPRRLEMNRRLELGL